MFEYNMIRIIHIYMTSLALSRTHTLYFSKAESVLHLYNGKTLLMVSSLSFL